MVRIVCALLTVLLGTACGAGSTDGPPRVVAAAYPLAWLVSQVGGPEVELVDLVKPGAEPHDIELSPRQVGSVTEADLVVYLKGFQPALDDALGDGDQGLELADVMDETGGDPHVWLDPVRMLEAVDALADRLAALDPDHADGYRARAVSTRERLEELDTAFRSGLTGCVRTQVVTSHSAFGYLTSRYGLEQRGISGLTPDAEPSPRDVAEVARFARDNGVRTIFFESLVDPKVARTVAAEIGATTAVLDPVEGVVAGDDYLTVQRRNLTALRAALDCR